MSNYITIIGAGQLGHLLVAREPGVMLFAPVAWIQAYPKEFVEK